MEVMKIFFLLLVIATFVNSHCLLTVPVSRGNQVVTQTACRYGNDAKRDSAKRTPMCHGPCDKLVNDPTNIPPTTIARGTTVTINWIRHYHVGGFIRFSWAPTPDSDSHAAFDSHVMFFMCKETPCNNDNEPMDCGTSFPIPLDLPDGPWTLSWAYFGGEFAAGDYYSCVDYIISGGPSSSTRAPVVFYGGDASNPGGTQCAYFQTNQLHVCTLEPCTNGTNPGGPHMGVPVDSNIIVTGSQPQQSLTTGQVPFTTIYIPAFTTQYQPPVTTGDNTPKVTTQPLTTQVFVINNQSGVTTGEEGTKWCYKDGTPNLQGSINIPPTCGALAPNARCADGQCCSTSGMCGPVRSSDGFFHELVDGISEIVSDDFAYNMFCKGTTADYRMVACDGVKYQISLFLVIFVLSFFI